MKQLIAPEIEAYVFEHTRTPSRTLEEVREYTYANVANPGMQVGRVEGALLRMLVGLSGARRVIEIGTYTGYSALCMAEALPEDGELITCEIDRDVASIARELFDRSPHGKKIQIRPGDARETLATLEGTFDLAFIDADKDRYTEYYETLLSLLRPGALIVADNTLWHGEVLDPQTTWAKGIAAFNKIVTADPRVDNVLLSVRDGIMLARKK